VVGGSTWISQLRRANVRTLRPLATAAAGDDRAAAVKQPQPSRVEEWCKTLREPAPLEDPKHGRDVGGWDYSQPVGHRHVSPALHGNGRTTTFRTAPSAAALLREPKGRQLVRSLLAAFDE
jgi:hypothetical protein